MFNTAPLPGVPNAMQGPPIPADDPRDRAGLDEARPLLAELKLRRLVMPTVEFIAKSAALRRALLKASAAGFSDDEIVAALGSNVYDELDDARFARRYAHVDEELRTLREVIDDYRAGVLSRDRLREKLLNWPYRPHGEPAEDVDPYDGPIHKQDNFSHVDVANDVGIIDDELYREIWNHHRPDDPL